jgi:hypothetical protein
MPHFAHRVWRSSSALSASVSRRRPGNRRDSSRRPRMLRTAGSSVMAASTATATATDAV